MSEGMRPDQSTVEMRALTLPPGGVLSVNVGHLRETDRHRFAETLRKVFPRNDVVFMPSSMELRVALAESSVAGSLGGEVQDGDFGISEVEHVDGDDYTWDWHADLRAAGSLGGEVLAGDFGISEVEQGPSGGSARPGLVGTLCDGAVEGLRYDVRTGPERSAWQVSTALYALERQLALMQQRLAAVEAELERCRGEL